MDILDCTIRDGGYINNWQFENMFEEYYKLMLYINVKYIEIGFNSIDFTYKNKLCGKFRFLSNDFLKKYEHFLVKEKNCIMINYESECDSYSEQEISNVDSCYFSMIRVAFNKNDYINALNLCKKLKNNGFIICANAMKTNSYSKDELIELVTIFKEYNLDYLYIADSYGNMNFNEIDLLYNTIINYDKNIKLGIHLHNSYQNANSNYNYIKYKEYNFKIIDSTLFGMGRGSGNLPTELIIINNDENYKLKEKIIKLIKFIIKYLYPLYGTNEWGYSLDYLYASYLNIHPTYVSKLRDTKLSNENIINVLTNIDINKSFDNNYLLTILYNFFE